MKTGICTASKKRLFVLAILIAFFGAKLSAQKSMDYSCSEKKAMRKASFIPGYFKSWQHLGTLITDSIRIDKDSGTADYYLNPAFTQMPIRNSMITGLKHQIYAETGRRLRKYTLNLWAKGKKLEEYVPNAFRDSVENYDRTRMSMPGTGERLITYKDRPEYSAGLSGSHIALWPSHGLFYDQQLDIWRWQRARLWHTVEDIFPWSFTSDFLVPMLENAGAYVFLPRERDVQTHEVIVDHDFSTGKSRLLIMNDQSVWDTTYCQGFGFADTVFPGENPFRSGTAMALECKSGDTSSVAYIPELPETGDYAVYISYSRTDKCASRVNYTVNYYGGRQEIHVNQCMGAGTWIYLGTFRFRKGYSPETGAVIISGKNCTGTVTTDAVKFGGGMGNIARRPADSTNYSFKISEKPRWTEGARYYLQYAGMPDSIVYSVNKGRNDYNDDYMSRPEWVNFLIGHAKPQYNTQYKQGLNIPIDLALAFHTDAGITENDSVIGTLGIFSTVRNNGFFPDGRSKLASRDLTDIIQTQLVNDIRSGFNQKWTRRGLWDREYSEAWRPVVPTMLLELLSHQNMADMRFGLDPRFRFDAARAVYKGILRYYSSSLGKIAPVIQPLAPDHMCIEVLEGKKVKLSWKPVVDPLEESAMPDGYNIYIRVEDKGFLKGYSCTDPYLLLELPEWGNIFSFKVTAFNVGGESFPGEIMSVCIIQENPNPVLIVNGFDRVSGPAFFDQGDMSGIAWWEDEGVPRIRDFSFPGYQYNFNRNSDWLHDDSQGWGASYADTETTGISGNTFDFCYIHGKALREAGYSFVSVSDEVFESPAFNTSSYVVTDVIFGEERGMTSFANPSVKDFRVFTSAFIEKTKNYLLSGGNIVISGAYIGTDMVENHDSAAIKFASDYLHYSWRTNHATSMGSVYPSEQGKSIFHAKINFNTAFDNNLYRVESPDGIEPAGDKAFSICRYSSGNVNAGIAFKGEYRCVALGFPIETVIDDLSKIKLMQGIVRFLMSK